MKRILWMVACATACATNGSPSAGGVVSQEPPPVTKPVSTDVDYRRIEQEAFAELNAARTNPRVYATRLAPLVNRFDGLVLQMPDGSRLRTAEGAAAVREAMRALNAQTPVPALTWADGLYQAARDLAVDQRRSGGTGHSTSQGAAPEMRIARYGTWQRSYAENVGYGRFATGEDVVVNLIIDDNVPSRGHRKNIFDPTAAVVGIACGPHPKFGSVCVFDQAGGFVSR